VADLIIGEPFAGPPGVGAAGSIYVVFGHRSSFDATFQFSSLDGTNGFRIDGEGSENFAGIAVSAGDVNGDGFDDVIVGADRVNGSSSGAAYVVFGHAGKFANTLSLSNLTGANGFKTFGAPGRTVGGGGAGAL